MDVNIFFIKIFDSYEKNFKSVLKLKNNLLIEKYKNIKILLNDSKYAIEKIIKDKHISNRNNSIINNIFDSYLEEEKLISKYEKNIEYYNDLCRWYINLSEKLPKIIYKINRIN